MYFVEFCVCRGGQSLHGEGESPSDQDTQPSVSSRLSGDSMLTAWHRSAQQCLQHDLLFE